MKKRLVALFWKVDYLLVIGLLVAMFVFAVFIEPNLLSAAQVQEMNSSTLIQSALLH